MQIRKISHGESGNEKKRLTKHLHKVKLYQFLREKNSKVKRYEMFRNVISSELLRILVNLLLLSFLL